MTDKERREIQKLRTDINAKFILQYESEWIEVVNNLKNSGKDLSKIELVVEK